MVVARCTISSLVILIALRILNVAVTTLAQYGFILFVSEAWDQNRSYGGYSSGRHGSWAASRPVGSGQSIYRRTFFVLQRTYFTF